MPGIAETLPRRAAAAKPREASPRAVLVIMCVGYFLVLLDVTIVNVALPQIGRGLGASVSGLQWVVDGYALALATLMLAGGTIGDLRGHKRVVLTGLVVFGAGSLACGIAPGDGVLRSMPSTGGRSFSSTCRSCSSRWWRPCAWCTRAPATATVGSTAPA